MLGLLRKFTFSRFKVAYELLSNLQNFNIKKFVINTGSLQSVYIFRIQRTRFAGMDSNFYYKYYNTNNYIHPKYYSA